MTNFRIIINSGQSTSTTYQTRSNVSTFQVTNSDNEYYQNGFIELFDTSNQHNIGDTVDIYINGNREFKGYISRREQTIDRGTKVTRYQLIGETYDLWRYHTDDYAIYSGLTSFIASSLVSSYCEGISSNFAITGGINLTEDINLTNMTVGDAIVRLTKLDGFRFYVRDGYLNYYRPNDTTTADFTITDSDIISMEPVEEADEDLVNDVLVLGATTYSKVTNVSPDASNVVPITSGTLYAQKFKVEKDTLSAIKLYLGRSSYPHQPDPLLFEIWKNTEQTLFNDPFSNFDYLNSNSGYNMTVGSYPKFNTTSDDKFGSFLRLDISSSSLLEVVPQPPYDTPKCCKMLAQVFKCTSNASVYWAYMPSTILYNETYDYHRYLITPTGSTGAPDLNNILGSSQFNSFGWGETRYYFPKTPKLESGNKYALVLVSKDYPNEPDTYCYDAWVSSGIYGDHGKYYVSMGGGTWAGTSATTPFKIKFIKFYKSGVIESKSKYKKTQYLMVTSSGVVSSNRIKYSGSNDNGSSWTSLQDSFWIDLGSESTNGTKVRYIMSSNGYYTPRIDSTLAKISDSTGSFELLLATDDFSSDSQLIYLHSSQISGGYLLISGNRDLSYFYPSKAVNIETYGNPSWSNYENTYDKDENTNGVSSYRSNSNSYDSYSIDEYRFSSSKTFYSYWDKARAEQDLGYGNYYPRKTYLREIYLSGLYTDGWKKVYDGYTEISPQGGDPAPVDVRGNISPSYWTDINKVKIKIFYDGNAGEDIRWRIWETKIKSFNKIDYTAMASSMTYTSNVDIYYLKIVLNGDFLDYVKISASADSGNSWVALVNNTRVRVPNEGKYIKLKYYLFPWSGGGNFWPNTPRLNSMTLYGYGMHGGGLPQSGSKIEWSDDITFNATDFPYPPSYSNWKSYTSPKLKLAGDEVDYTVGDYCWFILNGSENSEEKVFDTRNFDDESKWTVDQETHADIDDTNGWAKTLDFTPANELDAAIGRWAYPSGDFMNFHYTSPLPPGSQYVQITEDLPKYYVSMRVKADSSVANNSQIRLVVGKSGTTQDTYAIDIYNPVPTEWTVYTACLNDIYDYEISSGTMLWYYLDIYSDPYNAGASPPDKVYVDWIKIFGYPQIWYFYTDDTSTYDGEIVISDDGGVNWDLYAINDTTDVPPGNMKFKLGWDYAQVKASAQNLTSIDLYGRHFKRISDSNLTTLEQAQARADYEVSGSETIPKKGTITIVGRTNISPSTYFSANLSNFGINEKFSIRSYTHSIDKNGFLTTINYGKHPFDYVKKLADLEREVS